MKVELLYFDGCPSYEALLRQLRRTLSRAGVSSEIVLRRVESVEAAERERFLGSPTIRIDGRDVEPSAADRRDFGLKCRLYRVSGSTTRVPPEQWIAAAIDEVR